MSILIKDVSKSFGNFTALDKVSVEVPDGELLALLGPSGSGKTTLLRIIAGLEVADSGNVLHNEEDITHQSARDRKVGFVFQHYALFRHMTVAENIGYGLKVRKTPKAQIRERVGELLKLIRLEGLESRYPGQLSGGQRQRVALARALAAQPRVLLLDEPFGALDAKVRQELRQWLRRLHEEIQVTSIFVTHDQEEALEVSDRVVIMNHSRIIQSGTPADVYNRPATPFVYDFLGDSNRLHGTVSGGKTEIAGGIIELPKRDWRDGDTVIAYARPHQMMVHRSKVSPVCLTATVQIIFPVGPLVRVELTTENGASLVVKITQQRHTALDLQVGETVFVTPGEMAFFRDESISAELARSDVGNLVLQAEK
ncbi:MAG: cysA [Chthoniobacteraceae bacterium]|nr:cysA [Chthoniobacteraceae bacterium]